MWNSSDKLCCCSSNRSARRHSTELGFCMKRCIFTPTNWSLATVETRGTMHSKLPLHVRWKQFLRQMTTSFCNEAHFHLNGMANQQNFCYWALENLRELHERPLHNPKLTVWCTVGKTGVIGPYFFEDRNGNTVTVNSEMINNLFVFELRRRCTPIGCVVLEGWGVDPHIQIINGRYSLSLQ